MQLPGARVELDPVARDLPLEMLTSRQRVTEPLPSSLLSLGVS